MASNKNVTASDRFACEPTKNKKWAKRYGTSIRVGRRDYKLVWCEKIIDEEGKAIAGLCDPNGHTIYVDVTHDVEATLLHECFHAVINEAGFHQRGDWDANNEEHCAEVISQFIAGTFTLRLKKT